MNNKNTIIFYAPTGLKTKNFKIGGAEAGCRKTLEILKSSGYNVLLVEKPRKKSGSLIDSIFFIFVLFGIWLRLIKLFISNRNAVFHVAGFYLNQIYTENTLMRTANIYGLSTIYEIRNGGMIEEYNSRGNIYRYFMKSTLYQADRIFCQGYEYIPFIQKSLYKESVYYPNYIMDKYISSDKDERGKELKMNLVYLGRVVKDKNIEFIVDVCNQLQKHKMDFCLTIIGGFEDEYFNILSNRIQSYGLSKQQILFRGRLESDEIFSILKDQHFFLFPSKEKREGHSNSLTETMGCGVVPIASNVGFNASVINNTSLVISDFSPDKYASRIAEIWKSGQWKKFSTEVEQRVQNNYTESIVKKSFLKVYNELFNT